MVMVGISSTTGFPTLHERIPEDAVRRTLSNKELFGLFVSGSRLVIEDVSAARIQSLYLQRLFSAGDVCWQFSQGVGRPMQSKLM
jgi:hypothetical protein